MLFLPQVLLVTGGRDDDGNYLDSTEIIRSTRRDDWDGTVWKEITNKVKHRPMNLMMVTSLDNRVLLFGEW